MAVDEVHCAHTTNWGPFGESYQVLHELRTMLRPDVVLFGTTAMLMVEKWAEISQYIGFDRVTGSIEIRTPIDRKGVAWKDLTSQYNSFKEDLVLHLTLCRDISLREDIEAMDVFRERDFGRFKASILKTYRGFDTQSADEDPGIAGYPSCSFKGRPGCLHGASPPES